jgi:hypothetical protein
MFAGYPRYVGMWLYQKYRYLPAFCRSYFPNWKELTPTREEAIMCQLARIRFGGSYDADAGVLRFAPSRGQLKGQWAGVRPEDLRRPEVRFFLERNPGYTQGHELVCLTELRPDNLRPLARRVFLQGMAP